MRLVMHRYWVSVLDSSDGPRAGSVNESIAYVCILVHLKTEEKCGGEAI